MRKKIVQDAAFDVATHVREVEDSLDTTLENLAGLQCAMLRARRAANVSVVTGQGAFEELGVAIQALIGARGTIGKCHAELKASQQHVPGLREYAMGDGDDCPPPPKAEEFTTLRVVA